jgi:hypothetical protein
MSVNGNGGIRIPGWLAAILVPGMIGLGVWFYNTVDAKAQSAKEAAASVHVRQAAYEAETRAQWAEILRRFDRLEARLDNESPRRGGR